MRAGSGMRSFNYNDSRLWIGTSAPQRSSILGGPVRFRHRGVAAYVQALVASFEGDDQLALTLARPGVCGGWLAVRGEASRGTPC